MQDDRYRSLVYFTRDIGYAKPAQATDYLEFYWADWLRQQPQAFPLAGYDLTRAGATDPDPATADTGYLNAVWNASARMVASTDPVIDGKTGADLGRADQINGGKKYGKGNSTSCASRSRRTSRARSRTRSITSPAAGCADARRPLQARRPRRPVGRGGYGRPPCTHPEGCPARRPAPARLCTHQPRGGTTIVTAPSDSRRRRSPRSGDRRRPSARRARGRRHNRRR